MTGIYANGYGAAYVPMANTESAAYAQVPSGFQAVSASQSARIWGDPHIEAANGGKYDFQIPGIFNILSDSGLNLNARLTKKPGGNVAFNTEAGLITGDNALHFNADGQLEISYAGNTAVPVSLQDGNSYSLGQSSTITRHGDSYLVDSPEYEVKVDTNQEDQGMKYLNLMVSSGLDGVAADGVTPTGLLGETFNESQGQQSAPLDAVDAYRAPDLFSFATNSTVAQPLPLMSETTWPDTTAQSGMAGVQVDPYGEYGQSAGAVIPGSAQAAAPTPWPSTEEPYTTEQYAPAQAVSSDSAGVQSFAQPSYEEMLMQVLLQSVQVLLQVLQVLGLNR